MLLKVKVSARRDDRRHLRFDIAELQRAYGELKTTGEDAQPTEQVNDKAMTGHDQVELLVKHYFLDRTDTHSRVRFHPRKARKGAAVSTSPRRSTATT